MQELDPFAKSLVLRGVTHPPSRTNASDSPHRATIRGKFMGVAAVELHNTHRANSVKDLLRSDRVKLIMYSSETH